MTKEEAIKGLTTLVEVRRKYGNMQTMSDEIEALDMAIKALEQEPCDVFDEYGNYKYPGDVELTEPNTATSVSCEDAISRQAVIDGINQYFHDEYYQRTSIQDCRDCLIEDVIKDISPINPQLKTGHWIGIDEEPHEDYECDRCGYVCSTFTANIKPSEEYKYCPNCGAKMIEPQESEDKE